MGTNVFPPVNLVGNSGIDFRVAVTASTATTTLDLAQGATSVFEVLLASNTTFVFNNAPAGTNVFSFTIIINNDGTANRVASFPNTVKWAGGLIPPKTTTANATDVWSFFTKDAGATWVGSLAINDVK